MFAIGVYEMTQVFAAAAVAAAAVAAAVVAMACAARWVPKAAAALQRLERLALPAATVVVTAMTAGSLYLSEVAGFVPCELCWYQRICAYPLVVLGVVALIRRDRGVWAYMVPLAATGFVVSVYHSVIQAFPDLSAGTCAPTSPCTARHVWLWGFVSVPLMAAAGFAAVLAAAVCVFTARRLRDRSTPEPSQP